LATFDELEKYMYGGSDATAYFVRETRKSTWFTQVPVALSRASGSPGFGQEWSVSISRAGDYLLHTWLRCTIPKVTPVYPVGSAAGTQISLAWTKNLMHNLIRECCITFNDLVASRFDSFHLDFWAAFTVPAGKQNGYGMMIGNYPALTNPVLSSVAPAAATTSSLPESVLNLPIPLFYSRDSGVALPTAALPYNDMRLNFNFRDWRELLIARTNGGAGVPTAYTAVTESLVATAPVIGRTDVWANYAIVSNDERKRMGCAPRDILIEQVQTAPRQTFNPNSPQQYDIRFSHAIKVLFFAVRNRSYLGEWSNYTVGQPEVIAPGNIITSSSVGYDPIAVNSLIYENTNRLAQMGTDYFSLVNPYYFAPNIPDKTGYHMYSYSLDFVSLDPMGSTNYGKLTNVSMYPEPSQGAIDSVTAGTAVYAANLNVIQTFEYIVTAVNNNIIRVSGGALGFPVL